MSDGWAEPTRILEAAEIDVLRSLFDQNGVTYVNSGDFPDGHIIFAGLELLRRRGAVLYYHRDVSNKYAFVTCGLSESGQALRKLLG